MKLISILSVAAMLTGSATLGLLEGEGLAHNDSARTTTQASVAAANAAPARTRLFEESMPGLSSAPPTGSTAATRGSGRRRRLGFTQERGQTPRVLLEVLQVLDDGIVDPSMVNGKVEVDEHVSQAHPVLD